MFKKNLNTLVSISILAILSTATAKAADFQAQAGNYVLGDVLSQPTEYAHPAVFALSRPTPSKRLDHPQIKEDSGCRLYTKQTAVHDGIIEWIPRFLVCQGTRLDVSGSISTEKMMLNNKPEYLGINAVEFKIIKAISLK